MAADTTPLQLTTIHHLADDAGLSPVDTVGFNLVFLNVFDAGRAYTESEHRTWLTALGFTEIERIPLPEGVSIITARKPV